MHRISLLICIFTFSWLLNTAHAAVDPVTQSVWANEAIVATYTYNASNFLTRQQSIASYFTADGWKAFSTALSKAGIQANVEQNNYSVSAVATLPPTITTVENNLWQAVMPVLVVYQSPVAQQKQNLTVTMQFKAVPSGQGVRGYAIESMQVVPAESVWNCTPKKNL